MGSTIDKFGKDVQDVGVDPMPPALEAPLDWPLEFERQQKTIIELWHTCNVSLVHRTYFFLLFKGDPTDSIYLGVELRRLSFLKESFSHGNQTLENGRTLTLASRFSLSLSLCVCACGCVYKHLNDFEKLHSSNVSEMKYKFRYKEEQSAFLLAISMMNLMNLNLKLWDEKCRIWIAR